MLYWWASLGMWFLTTFLCNGWIWPLSVYPTPVHHVLSCSHCLSPEDTARVEIDISLGSSGLGVTDRVLGAGTLKLNWSCGAGQICAWHSWMWCWLLITLQWSFTIGTLWWHQQRSRKRSSGRCVGTRGPCPVTVTGIRMLMPAYPDAHFQICKRPLNSWQGAWCENFRDSGWDKGFWSQGSNAHDTKCESKHPQACYFPTDLNWFKVKEARPVDYR